MTVYKKIPRYEGIYEASDHGTIWSVEGKQTTRKMKNGQIQKRIWKRRQIMPKREKRPRSKHSDLRVDLWKNGSHKTKLVSRLVASAFIPNPENKPCINHIDGNPLNNVPKNLEWCTYKENQKHAFKTGINKSSKRVVLVGSYDNIQHSFISMAEASNFLGMSHGFISGLVNRGITNFG